MTRTGIFASAGLMLVLCLGGQAAAHEDKSFTGLASVYSDDYSGPTASGERYDPRQFTAAHRNLPFGTLLRVTDLHSRRSVTVVVNDRGPFVGGRVLDLSRAAAKALGIGDRGIAKVSAMVEYPRAFRLRDLLSRNER